MEINRRGGASSDTPLTFQGKRRLEEAMITIPGVPRPFVEPSQAVEVRSGIDPVVRGDGHLPRRRSTSGLSARNHLLEQGDQGPQLRLGQAVEINVGGLTFGQIEGASPFVVARIVHARSFSHVRPGGGGGCLRWGRNRFRRGDVRPGGAWIRETVQPHLETVMRL